MGSPIISESPTSTSTPFLSPELLIPRFISLMDTCAWTATGHLNSHVFNYPNLPLSNLGVPFCSAFH